MKDLPRVFPGKVKENINNTQSIFYGNGLREAKDEKKNIIHKINEIFASSHHVYKSKVAITFKDKEVEKVIVGKTSTDLITIDGELIKIIDIVDIKKIY